jgi:CPA1 family monovalent cation:H+ antiporter
MSETHFTITVFIVLLLVASGVAMLTKWISVPYTLALVIVGLVISPMHFLPAVHISPDLILLIFLPALLFEAAWSFKLEQLKANLLPILSLAVIGVGISVVVIGFIVHYATGISWSAALLFGSIISATDPVSVLSLFKRLGAPQRLTVIIEGESLFNDGTSVVLFTILLNIATGTAHFNSTAALLGHLLGSFLLVALGGLALGAAVGFIASRLTSHFDDHLLEITLTTIAAYGSFIIAERIHVSPVIAVLVTGFVIGNYGRRKGMSKNTEVAVDSFWEYAAFVVNSLAFLLIGLEIQLLLLRDFAWPIFCAFFAMIVARAIVTYGMFVPLNRFSQLVPWRWQHVLIWGGLRGALSIALALSLPLNLPDRLQLIMMTFGAVTFSLLLQGLTLSPMLKVLKLTPAEKRQTGNTPVDRVSQAAR